MQSVIETLLTVARRDADPSRGASDARSGAARAVDALRTSAEHAGITLAYVPSATVLRVGADEDTVAQALGPLLENAVRHAASRVTVALERENGHVEIAVQDDGPGFGDADLGALFEPGTSSVRGAGLGLPLARRVARACGGDVTADASAAGGLFVLRLPGVVSASR